MNQNDPPTEHILACLSSSPSNAKIVRTAATMARAFGGTFTALYVRTPDSDQMGKEDCRRLQQHIRMAEQAGADISTIYGDDIPQQIAEFARISGITKIVLGSSSVHRRHFWSGPSLTEKLTMTAPNLDIYIIPDASAENGYGSGRKLFARPLLPSVRDLLITAGILSCITLIGFFFLQLDFARYNIIMLYMLGVLFTALCTSGYTCGVLGSVAGVALYNFFLTEPRLTFHAYDPGYQVTFALMLTSAIITCALTTRLKDHAKMSAQAAFRTKVLFDTNQLLQRAKNEEEILSQTASQLMKLLNRSLIVYPEQNGDLGSEQVFGIDAVLSEKVIRSVIQYCNAQMMDKLYTWQGVNNALLRDRLSMRGAELLAAESEKNRMAAEADELIESVDEDIQKLKKQVEELTHANEILTYENQGLRSKMSSADNMPIMYLGEEEEFYQGEIREMILDAIAEKLKNLGEKTRRWDVLTDVLNANDYQNIRDERERTVKILFKDYKTLSASMRQQLLELGFEITDAMFFPSRQSLPVLAIVVLYRPSP